MVEGIVLSQDRPVIGASVSLLLPAFEQGSRPARDELSGGRWHVTAVDSDPRGRFRFEVDVELPRWWSSLGWVKVEAPGFPAHYAEVPVHDQLGISTQTVLDAIRLEPAARLTGRVMSNGQAVSLAEVVLFAGGEPAPPEPLVVRSDSEGYFEVDSARQGDLVLMVSHPEYSSALVENVALRSPEEQNIGSISLSPPDWVTGRLVDNRNRGIAGVRLRAREVLRPKLGRDWITTVETSSDTVGRFRLKLPPMDGLLEIELSKQGFVTELFELAVRAHEADAIRPDDWAPNVRFVTIPDDLPKGTYEHELDETVTMQRAVTLRGRVTDEQGIGVSGAEIDLLSQSADDAFRESSDARGGFSFTELRPGDYSLEVRAPSFHRTHEYLLLAETAPAEPHEVRLRAIDTVELVIKVSNTRGAPVAGAEVSLAPNFQDPPKSGFPARKEITDAEGRTRLAAIPLEGRYDVVVRHHGYLDSVLDAVEVDPSNPILEIESRSDERPRHSVAGLVEDVDGEPITGATVRLAPDPANLPRRFEWRQLRYPPVLTDVAGRFEHTGILEGIYRLTTSFPGLKPRQSRVAVSRDLAVPEVVLGAGVLVEGVLEGLTREELADARVRAESEAGSTVQGHVVEGSFRLEDLGPGTWSIEATAGGRSARQGLEVTREDRELWAIVSFEPARDLEGVILVNDRPVEGGTIGWAHGDLDFLPFQGGVPVGADGRFRLTEPTWGNREFLRYEGPLGGFIERLPVPPDAESTVLRKQAAPLVVVVVDQAAREFVSGVEVRIHRQGTPQAAAETVTTNERGIASFGPKILGRWVFNVSAGGYEPLETTVEHKAGSKVVPLALGSASELDIQVTTASGKIPGSVKLLLFDGEMKLVTRTTLLLDQAGRGTWEGVPTGSWFLVGQTDFAQRGRPAKVPGPEVLLDFRPAGRLLVEVPTLFPTDARPRPELGIKATMLVSDDPAYAGAVLTRDHSRVRWIPAGLWQVRVLAGDGRAWEKTVRIEDGVETTLIFEEDDRVSGDPEP